MLTVLVLHGPNLNLLGRREPDVYGTATLADVERRCAETAAALGLAVDARQTNSEGTLIDWVHEGGEGVRAGRVLGAVVNPGALTHTSLALHDAVVGAALPVVEVHLSNVHAREPVRRRSYLSPVARGVVTGFGVDGYELAVRGLRAVVPDPA